MAGGRRHWGLPAVQNARRPEPAGGSHITDGSWESFLLDSKVRGRRATQRHRMFRARQAPTGAGPAETDRAHPDTRQKCESRVYH